MASANPNYTDIIATTIESRSKTIADNVTNNNALLTRLSKKGKIRPFSGGYKILQELTFAENANLGWYSGYDLLPVGVSDIVSASEFEIKQAACPVVISGLEQLQNAGEAQMIDLMETRIQNAEASMANLITAGLYSDGTGSAGKEITGLSAALPIDPTATPYANIDGNVFTFWQNAVSDNTAAAVTATTVQGLFNLLWSQLVRGNDRPDLIMTDSVLWNVYVASLQAQQRFSNTDMADAGFASVKFMDSDVVLDGGIYNGTGTGAPAGTGFFLNTNYIHFRPHSARNMVTLSPGKRYSVNQDASSTILAWAGNLTCSGRMFQGRFDMNG